MIASGKFWAWMLLSAYVTLTLHDFIPHHHSEDLHVSFSDLKHLFSEHDHHSHDHGSDKIKSGHHHLADHQEKDMVLLSPHGPKNVIGQMHILPTSFDWVHSHGWLYRPPVSSGYTLAVTPALVPVAFNLSSLMTCKVKLRPFDGHFTPPAVRHPGDLDPRGPPSLV